MSLGVVVDRRTGDGGGWLKVLRRCVHGFIVLRGERGDLVRLLRGVGVGHSE